MQTRNPFLNDLARFAGYSADAAKTAGQEIENLVKERVEAWIIRMDLVPREDLDVARQLAVDALEKCKALHQRIERLEALMASTAPGRNSSKKPAAKTAQKARKKDDDH